MPPPTVDDQLWELIQPLLLRRTRRYRHPGRRPLDDRKVSNGILFVLKTGIACSFICLKQLRSPFC